MGTKNFLFWNIRRWKIRYFFEQKIWWKYEIYWLLKSSCFKFFGDGKYGGEGVFWAKKLMGRLYLLITEKFLVWTSLRWEIRSFFESKSWLKDDIYWLLKIYCFELFGDWNRVCFSAKKLMERWYLLGLFELFMIF